MISPNHQETSAADAQAMEADLSVALNLIVRDSLKPIATGLSVMLIVLTIGLLVFSPREGPGLLVAVNALAAIGMFGFRMALERWTIPYRWANPVGAMLAVLVLLICLFVMRFMPESQQTINLLLLVIGTSFISLSAHWLLAVFMATLIGLSLMIWTSPPAAEWLHFSFALFCASILSMVIHTIRVRTLGQFETFRIKDQKRADELNAAMEALRERERLQLIFENSPIPMVITRKVDGTILYANQQVSKTLDLPNEKMIGRKAVDFYADPNDRNAILAQINADGALEGYELKAKTASNRTFWILVSIRPLTFDGEPALLGSFIDITEQKLSQEIRERYTHMQAALVQANKSLVSTIDLDSLLVKILAAAHEAVPAMEKGSILLWDENTPGLRMKSVYGYQDPRVAQAFLSTPEGFVARVALQRRPLVIKDVRKHADLQYHGEIEEMQAIQSAVVAPLIVQDRLLGVISLDATHPCAFTEDDLTLLVTFANQAALAIDNARLYEQVCMSEERYRALYEDNPSMYFTVDQEGKVLSVNRYGAEQLGYTVPELIGQPVLNVFYEDDKPQVLQQMQNCLQNRSRLQYWEFRKMRKDGSILWVGEYARAVQDRDGNTVLLIVCEDITERKNTEKEVRRLNEELEQRVLARTKELRESEERFRQLAENIADVFWLDTGDLRRTLYVSPAYEKIWGRSCQSLLKNPVSWCQAIHPEDREKAIAGMNHWLQSGMQDTYSREYRIVRPDGGQRWIFNRAFPIRHASGEVYRIAGIAKDITERKTLEEQVQKYNSALKLLVDERTERIRELEKQRIESEKLAATGRMAARIAHEINNPLGFIRTAFRLVSRAIPDTDRHYHYIGTIEKEIERIAKIVHQMLDLHRPYQESPKKFRFDETIAEILVLLKAESYERRVSFELEAERAHDFITLPENMLRQIIYNVVLNAVEVSPPDGIIRVAAEIADHELQITIADQGAGIPEEIGSRIFEPFFTTKNQSTTGGMGLGLSICKSLVEAMQGTIGFESKPSAGTVFKITIALNNDDLKGGPRVEPR